MAHRSRRLAAILAAILAATVSLLTASPARAESRVIGAWVFSEVPIGPVAAGAAFAVPALYAAGDRTALTVVQSSRGPVLDVATWRGLRPGDAVARSASSLSTDPAFWAREPWGADGTSTTFDPAGDDFSVSVWLRPNDAAAFPRGTKPVGSVNPNVVQKGRANAAGGYWKVGLQMVRTALGVAWAPGCVLRGRDGATAVANRSGTVLDLTPGVGAEITCARVGDRLTLTVAEDGTSVRSSSVGGAGGDRWESPAGRDYAGS